MEILDVSIHVSVRSSILYCFWSTPVVVLSNNHALSTLIISIITGTKNILPHTAVWTLPSYISNRTKWFSLLGLFQCCIYSFYVINSLCYIRYCSHFDLLVYIYVQIWNMHMFIYLFFATCARIIESCLIHFLLTMVSTSCRFTLHGN